MPRTLGSRWPILAGTARGCGGGGRNRTGVDGFAGRCMTTLPPRQERRPAREARAVATNEKGEPHLPTTGSPLENSGAGKESRTPDLNLGKVALYQLSYSRIGQPLIINDIPLLSKRVAPRSRP